MSRIGPDHLAREAIVYVRQSTPTQLRRNHESRRRQYGLADRARELGWAEPAVIDEDLGRSGGGAAQPSFERLLVAICEGRVGIVLSLEASRLARNGRDWHTLLVFRKFAEFRSIRQVHLWLRQEEVLPPAARGRRAPRRVEAAGLQHGPPHAHQPGLRRGVRLRTHREPRHRREWPQARRARQPAPTRGLGRVDPRPPRGLRCLGGLREEPAADRRQRQLPRADGQGRRAQRRRPARGSAALRTLRPAAARPLQRHEGLLRALRVPRRAHQPRHQALHRLRRPARGRRGRPTRCSGCWTRWAWRPPWPPSACARPTMPRRGGRWNWR